MLKYYLRFILIKEKANESYRKSKKLLGKIHKIIMTRDFI